MHNQGKSITCNCTIGRILDKCTIVTVSMVDENRKPYAVSAKFVHEAITHKVERLYYICDNASLDLDIISKNSEVFFNTYFAETTTLLFNSTTAGASDISISGKGAAAIVTDQNERVKAMGMIMKKYPAYSNIPLPVITNDNSKDDKQNQEYENITVVSIEIDKVVGEKLTSVFA